MTTSNQVFTDNQQKLLTSALNRIIPAEGDFSGAGDLGLSGFVEKAVSQNTKLRRLFTEGLAQIEIAASKQFSKDFTTLPGVDQDAVLKEVQAKDSAFFDSLVRQCYNGYYTNPAVHQLIGFDRPSPEEYEYKPIDETLLEPQRQRAPFWTQV